MADAREQENGPKERAYDDRVSPLMRQVIALCRETGIPFYASFMLDGDLACTSCYYPPWAEVSDDDREHVERFRRVHDQAQRANGAPAESFAITITRPATAEARP